MGGGALPLQKLPTRVIVLSSAVTPVSVAERRMREHEPPVIVRIQRDKVCIDLRTVAEKEEDELEAALIAGFASALV